jgi:hypothetical protein
MDILCAMATDTEEAMARESDTIVLCGESCIHRGGERRGRGTRRERERERGRGGKKKKRSKIKEETGRLTMRGRRKGEIGKNTMDESAL